MMVSAAEQTQSQPATAVEKFSLAKSEEDERIEAAREALFGVDSVASLSDFEVSSPYLLSHIPP